MDCGIARGRAGSTRLLQPLRQVKPALRRILERSCHRKWAHPLPTRFPSVGPILACVLLACNPGAGQEVEPGAKNEPIPTPSRDRPAAPPQAKGKTRQKAPGSREFGREREAMVVTQIKSPKDGRRPVTDPAALAALRAVPRHVFVPERLRQRAYADSPLPIGHGQTISQPYIVALMTDLLELGRESKVLEIGTGSGYQAAVLAQVTPHVYTVEIIKPLAERASAALASQGYKTVRCRHADGYHGWKEEAPFDAIIVTCAAGHLPPPLWQQLKPGGRIVIPIGGPYELQRLVVVTKTAEGKRRSKTIIPVRFVPLTRN